MHTIQISNRCQVGITQIHEIDPKDVRMQKKLYIDASARSPKAELYCGARTTCYVTVAARPLRYRAAVLAELSEK